MGPVPSSQTVPQPQRPAGTPRTTAASQVMKIVLFLIVTVHTTPHTHLAPLIFFCVFVKKGPAIFRVQLEQLEQMGFSDRQANIRGMHTHPMCS